MYYIKKDNKTIEYQVIRTKRKKTIGIVIDPDKGVIIRAPKRISDGEIQKIVKKKSDWIFRKLDKIAQIKPVAKPKEYVSGEKLLYLGKKYKLLLCEDEKLKKVFIRLEDNMIQVCFNPDKVDGNKREAIRAELINWYYGQAKWIIKERIEIYQSKVGETPSKIKIKNQKKRWGSCSSKGNLNFNWKLIMAPLIIIDYIVVHELTHLVHPNHSKNFWNKLASIVPDYKEREEWLRVNVRRLIL